MDTVRRLVKGIGERVLTVLGVDRLGRWLLRDRTVVLSYHNIVPEDSSAPGDRSLHLPVDRFGDQLDLLLETHEVVPLGELWNRTPGPGSRDDGRPRAVLTFDDAYTGALTLGVRELGRRGLPVTVFVSPGLLDGRAFWWDRIGPDPTLLRTVRERALHRLCGSQTAILRELGLDDADPDLPDHALSSTLDLLGRAVRSGDTTLGAHGWSHRNLAALTPDEMRDELRRPLEWLEDRFAEAVIPWLAYPYGIRNDTVERAAREAGYRGAFLVSGGACRRRDRDRRPYALPRMNVPRGLSLRGFALGTAGVRPA